MKNVLSIAGFAGAVLVIAAMVITAIFGTINVVENNWEETGDYGYNICRADSPFTYTNYRVRDDGPCAGLREVERENILFGPEFYGYESYKDTNGDGKVDTIFICRFGRDLYLTGEDRDNPEFAKEFLKADSILLQTKLRFYDRIIAIELKRALGIDD